jgi:hypothetical protein
MTDLAPNAAQAWNDPDNTGLGYTMAAVTVTSPKNTPVAAAMFAGGTNYTRLATAVEQDPIVVASSAGIAEGDVYNVCYRLSIDAQNNAGVYDNAVVYTITASF